ncbi:MAG: DNA-3-methyladenine glycosylase [Mycobacterium sp.]|nr:DNA-3-methyladenine glycosylase [Mycobacterium sp.]
MSAEVLDVDPVTAALRLLGAVISAAGVSARIVEVEAYGGPPGSPWPDPAAHSYRGKTERNAVMFGPPGRLYTYRSYGIHVCANISCGSDGTAAAVLLRAAAIRSGADEARMRRGPPIALAGLARGPGNLCSALGITMEHNGIDVFTTGSAVTVRLGESAPASAGPRVGVSQAADRAWRFWLPDAPEVSAYRRSARALPPGASD